MTREYNLKYEKIKSGEAGAIYLLLFIFWIILAGNLTLEIALFGLLISALVWTFAAHFLGWGIRRELLLYRLIPYIAAYAAALLWEIVKSAACVVPYAIGVRRADGVIVEFDSGLKRETSVAVLANSITMTPGTITVAAANGRLTVHCLSPAFARGIESTSFSKRLLRIEAAIDKFEKSKKSGGSRRGGVKNDG